MTRFWHAPGDWLGTRFSARQRRSFATWLLIVFVGTVPLRYAWRNTFTMIWLLSELALWIGLLAVVVSETPVEEE